MNVNEIIARVVDLSHDEDAPDTALGAKALGWINSAYHEVMDELLPFMARYIQTSTVINTDSNGAAELANNAYRIMRVIDNSSGRVLMESTLAEILAADPERQFTGAAQWFYMENNTLRIYPASRAELEVVYLPYATNLNADDTEASIGLPANFHSSLVWGALVWGSTYERTFSSQGDLRLFQAKWDEAKQKIKLSLNANPNQLKRVQAFDILN